MNKEIIWNILAETLQIDKLTIIEDLVDEDIMPFLIKHRLEGAFYYKYINKLMKCNISSDLIRDLRIKFEYYNLRDTYIKKELKQLDEILCINNLQYKLTKGVVLSECIYNKGVRYYGDIDIIIRKEQLDKVKKSLVGLGYQQGRLDNWRIYDVTDAEKNFYEENTHQTIPFFKLGAPGEIPLCVDVNFALSSGEPFENKNFINFIFNDNSTIQIVSNKYPTISIEMLFINVCVNLYRDAMSLVRIRENKDIYLYQYMDIYMLIQSRKVNMQKLKQIIIKYNLKNIVFYVLANLKNMVDISLMGINLDNTLVDNTILNKFGSNLDKDRGEWKIGFKDRILESNRQKYMNFY